MNIKKYITDKKEIKKRVAWSQTLEGATPIKWYRRPIVRFRMWYWGIENKIWLWKLENKKSRKME